MILQLIEDNFVAVTITSFLILFIITNNNFEKRTNRLFLMAAASILILIIEEAWEAKLALSPVYEPLRVPLSALGYTLRPMIPFWAMLIVKKYQKNQLRLLAAPLVFNMLVAFSAFFCKLSFSYTITNEFVRGPLGYTPFVVSAIYVFGTISLMLKTYRDMSSMEMTIISAIVLLAFITTIMESMFNIQFIQCPSMATSLTFYYMFLHSNQNNRDPLTGAFTRRKFYLDSKKFHASLSAVVSLDLNDLKKLNDQHTHMEGDKALRTVAGVIKQYTGVNANFYRVGGDEFMILCYKMNENDVKKMIQGIQSSMMKTDYRCAIGYSMMSDNVKFDVACQKADNFMYENKHHMKKDVLL